MKPIFLKDLINMKALGIKEVLLIVREKTIVDNSIRYILGDITEDITFISSEKAEEGDIVVATFENGGIKNISLYAEGYDLEDYMPHTKRNMDSILEELEQLTTNTFQDEEVVRLNNYFFSNEEFVRLFSKGIGGFGHHIYIGGLAEHTLNVVYWASKLSDRYHCKYRDMAVLSAKLHDIGKIYEYSHSGSFKSTFRGEMEGHIVIGITMIEEAFQKDGYIYSAEFKNRLKGCIVQHHGMTEYGSPKSPNTEEAYIVHFADYIDATMNKIEKVKSETPNNTWSKFSEELKTKLFV